MKKQAYIFGTGKLAQSHYRALSKKYHVIGFLDNSVLKHGKVFLGLPVLDPSSISIRSDVYVIIASSYVEDISHQLIALGVTSDLVIIPLNLFWNDYIILLINNFAILMIFILAFLGCIYIIEFILN
jgi:hypothetical protein